MKPLWKKLVITWTDHSVLEFYNVRIIQDNTGHVLTLREEQDKEEVLIALDNVKYIRCIDKITQKKEE